MKVAVLGLGFMGSRIAGALIEHGHTVTVYNRTASKAVPLVQAGAMQALTPAEAASGQDVVITVLMAEAQVEECLFGGAGVVNAPVPPGLVMDCSTISPTALHRINARLEAVGIPFLDAPVTGIPPEMVVFVGGPQKHAEQVRPILDAIAREHFHVGDTGSGNATKLVNQLLLYSNYAAVFEGLGIIDSVGLDAAIVASALSAGAADSIALQRTIERGPDFDITDNHGAPLKLIKKDLGFVSELANERGAAAPYTKLLNAVLESAVSEGSSEAHFSAFKKNLLEHTRSTPPGPLKLVRRFVDCWNRSAWEEMASFVDPGFRWQGTGERGFDSLAAYLANVRAGISSGSSRRIDIVAAVEGSDSAAVRLEIRADGRLVRTTNDIFLVRDGRIVEELSGHE